MITITKNSNLESVASKITRNSETFNDEIASVIHELRYLLNEAEKFGCPMSAEVSNWWGKSVLVTAKPSKPRHEWTF